MLLDQEASSVRKRLLSLEGGFVVLILGHRCSQIRARKNSVNE